jgi:hypothetical protein
MLTEQQKSDIKSFYLNQIRQNAGSNHFLDYLKNQSIGYVQLGDELGYLDVQQYDPPEEIPSLTVLLKLQGLPEVVKLKKIDSESIPNSVCDAFQRHIWYSRYVLTDIRVVKFNVSNMDTFGIYSASYGDDGWSSSLVSWEIYLLDGEFLGSLINGSLIDYDSNQSDLLDRVVNYNDFDLIVPPPYDPTEVQVSSSPIFVAESCYKWMLPLWSESDVALIK